MKPNNGIAVNLIRHVSDSIASDNDTVNWASAQLSNTLTEHGFSVGAQGEIQIHAAGADSAEIQQQLQTSGLDKPSAAESFCIINDKKASGQTLAVIGADAKGIMYGLLELADRVAYSEDPQSALSQIDSYAEKPANKVRSINRLFVSEVEDKPWFYDKSFWNQYLTELAVQRFNRIHLALGMGYDYGHDPGVVDNYFCFAYPYLLNVPGYNVRVAELQEGERERNLETLQYIAKEAKRRGIHFQLGIWTHAYVQDNSPDSDYKIEGVDATNHAAYCRDALQLLLETCPDIDGVTIRTHYEGGIPEPAHLFWEAVMRGVTACGRPVEIDMHTKGVDDQMLQIFMDTGMPIVLSPKFWAEHMGLPYHQTAIRPWELPVASTDRPDLMSITATYRRFTRYGYGDYLKEGHKYGVLHRIWPGTQRILLWGDPAMAAGYSRRGSFCGSIGIELSEPLAFKGRKGSGVEGGREPYKDSALQLDGQEWKKYLYYYRLWGRLLYNPDTDAEVWQRFLRRQFKAAAADCGQALAHAGRILPLMTAAHLPSAANNVYWPEIYTDQTIVNTGEPSPYDFDTPAPKTFGAVSPLDPQLFYRIDDFVQDSLDNRRSGKLSPLEVADRLSALADAADRHLNASASLVSDKDDPSYRRLAVDVAVQAGLGHFYAHKMRAAVSYAWYERTGSMERLEEALNGYRQARSAWQQIVDCTIDVYQQQLAYGYRPLMRGSWADRIEGIEANIAAMEQVYRQAEASGVAGLASSAQAGGLNAAAASASASVAAGTGASSAVSTAEQFIPAAASIQEFVPAAPVMREYPDAPAYADIFPAAANAAERPACLHESPAAYRKGEPLVLRVKLSGSAAGVNVKLLYRHVNQAESYEIVPMSSAASGSSEFTAVIPASYTDTIYPIAYYFELQNGQGVPWLSPGLDADLSNQPYYAVRQQA